MMPRVSVKQKWHGRRVKRLVGEGIRRALDDAGDRLADAAKRRAPVDTGRLRGSIDHSEARKVGRGRYRVVLYAGVDYAAFVELGTRYARKQPYLVPARSNAARLIRRSLKRNMSRI